MEQQGRVGRDINEGNSYSHQFFGGKNNGNEGSCQFNENVIGTRDMGKQFLNYFRKLTQCDTFDT